MPSITERAERGAALLDEKMPYGFDGGSFEETRALTPAWRDLITRRRELAGVST